MNYVTNLLYYLFFIPLISILTITLIPKNEITIIKLIALNSSFLSLLISIIIWIFFYKITGQIQFYNNNVYLSFNSISICIGLDGISLIFLMLTTFLIVICILNSWKSVNYWTKEFLIFFLLLEFFLIGSFCVFDLLFFYIFFESILIPMFFIIGIWGSKEWKVLASYYFFFYTLIGSGLMILSILYIYFYVGSTNYKVLIYGYNSSLYFSQSQTNKLWLLIFIAFSFKIPMIPFHIWLPEAHVEAPTAGSIILAGVLLKLGTYGIIRFLIPIFLQSNMIFTPFVYTIATLGIIYTSLTAIRQTDIKRIIAYTSIAHMNYVILGIFSHNLLGLEGSIFQSLSHGFVSSAFFLLIGILYDRYKTWMIIKFGGFVSVMPMYISTFLFLTLANMSFPGTSSFIGELLIFIGSYSYNSTITILSSTSIVLSGIYSLWLYNRISYGNIKIQYIGCFIDLSFRETVLITILSIFITILGLYPNIVINILEASVHNIFLNHFWLCFSPVGKTRLASTNLEIERFLFELKREVDSWGWFGKTVWLPSREYLLLHMAGKDNFGLISKYKFIFYLEITQIDFYYIKNINYLNAKYFI